MFAPILTRVWVPLHEIRRACEKCSPQELPRGGPWPRSPRGGHYFSRRQLLLEPQINTCIEPKVALVVVPTCKAGAKARQYVIKLPDPDGNGPGNPDIDASADDEIEGIVAGRFRVAHTGSQTIASGKKMSTCIGVSATKQCLDKRLKVRSAKFNYWPNVVGKQIGLDTPGTASGADRSRQNKVSCLAPITLKVTLDSKCMAEVKRYVSSPTVQ